VTLSTPRPEAVLALQPLLEGEAHVSHDGRRLRAAVLNRDGIATAAVRALDRAGILVDDVQVHQPSLDDVFLALAGRESAEEETALEREVATA
jgi:ABC-2 type transport system ATP-binding protein